MDLFFLFQGWCITCCYICYMCQMYKRYDECCATPMAMFFPGLTLRVYHRARHNIEVSSNIIVSKYSI